MCSPAKPAAAECRLRDAVRNCLKCREKASQVVVRSGGTHGYCKECFLLMVTHKFRSLIGKQRVIERDEAVSLRRRESCASARPFPSCGHVYADFARLLRWHVFDGAVAFGASCELRCGFATCGAATHATEHLISPTVSFIIVARHARACCWTSKRSGECDLQ